MDSSTVHMMVRLVGGVEHHFEFTESSDSRMRLATRLREFMSNHAVALQLEDKMLLIPMAQIECIEISPSPGGKIEGVLGPAKQV